jgi:hypothetical protein
VVVCCGICFLLFCEGNFSIAGEHEGSVAEGDVLDFFMLFLFSNGDNSGASGPTLEVAFKNLFGKGTKYEAKINVTEIAAPAILIMFP